MYGPFPNDVSEYTFKSGYVIVVVPASVPFPSYWSRYFDYLKEKKEAESRAITTQDRWESIDSQVHLWVEGVETKERIGLPRLGGPFELVDRLWRSDNGHQRQDLQKANDFGRKGKAVTEKDFLGQCSVHSSSSWNCLNFVDFTFSLQWINDWQDLLIRGICWSISASPFALIFVHRHIISLLFSEE